MGRRGAESHAGRRRWCWKESGMRGTREVAKPEEWIQEKTRRGLKASGRDTDRPRWKEVGKDMAAEGRDTVQFLLLMDTLSSAGVALNMLSYGTSVSVTEVFWWKIYALRLRGISLGGCTPGIHFVLLSALLPLVLSPAMLQQDDRVELQPERADWWMYGEKSTQLGFLLLSPMDRWMHGKRREGMLVLIKEGGPFEAWRCVSDRWLKFIG